MTKSTLSLRLATSAIMAVALLGPLTIAGAEDRPTSLAPLGDPPSPPDNPTTPAKVELGKMLFFDGRLSGNGSMACVACHTPDAGWDFPEKISLGYPGTTHWRNSQTIINSAYYSKLFWAGASKSLEGQARSAARGGVAGNGEDDMMEAKLAFVPEYRKRFREVFGDTWPNVRHAYMAIAAFERTLVQTDTPFDKYMRGDNKALNAAQKRGLALFTGKAGCVQCHSGALLSNEKYYNLGLPPYDGWETDPVAQITYRFEIYAKGVTEDKYRKLKDDPG
ncbi:MAG: cytochrome-c peroxidase, partial [Rhizobiales bacterium]|nr:cytochrome-c peroxidase [Hyphomicrobiales bacterium]